MSALPDRFFRFIAPALLRVASVLVPSNLRAEWLREWLAELWHVRQSCEAAHSITAAGQREILAFALGAFPDAFYLRLQAFHSESPFTSAQQSPQRCVFFLAALLATWFALALLLPGVRAVRSLAPAGFRPDIVLIRYADAEDNLTPAISSTQFHAWNDRKQQYFDGFAFYRSTTETVQREAESAPAALQAHWQIGQASPNLLALLGVPVRFQKSAAGPDAQIPSLILSEFLWKREFGADPAVAGTIVRISGRRARIAGVAPDGSWGLPGNIGAWLLQPDSQAAPTGPGFLLARLTPAGVAQIWAGRVPITVYSPNFIEYDLVGLSLGNDGPDPWSIFLFTLFLALISLPATTSVSLDELAIYPQDHSQTPSISRKLYRWVFLATKIALILPIVYFASLDLAYACTGFDANTAIYIHLIASFTLCLGGLNWTVRDQRHRCPVCLRRVAHPAQVGQPSRTFLAWNGTELMCMGGHTLLHVPGLPTSWFSTQRWLYLDSSWSFLFPDSPSGLKKELTSTLPAH